ATIQWDGGPSFGEYRVTSPVADFFVIREVNVVQVALIFNDTNNRFAFKDRSLVVPDPDTPKGVLSSRTPPAMYASIKVRSIDGPVRAEGRHRGIRFIDVGFMQVGTIVNAHSDYTDTLP